MEIPKERLIEIGKVLNGFIVKHYIYEDDDEKGNKLYTECEEVIEEEEKDNSDKLALKELLFKVAHLCGYQYDKYGEENLEINFDKKGHKLD